MTHKCKECGKEEDASRWMKSTGNRLVEQGLCFTCDHWEQLLPEQPGYPRAVVEGKHYLIGPESARGMRGYGGRRFLVEFFDGRRLETTNLWHQGEIPEHYRGRLPDNAKWGK